MIYNKNNFICHNCKLYLTKQKMPPLSQQNGLRTAIIPDCLKVLVGLEKQLIKKSLPFLKIRQLPKTLMDVTNDKIVNVPISDDDLVKTVTTLPRTKENDGVVNLKFKRRMKQKSYYRMQAIRPEMTYKALLYLNANKYICIFCLNY